MKLARRPGQKPRWFRVVGWSLVFGGVVYGAANQETYSGDASVGIENAVADVGALLVIMSGILLLALNAYAAWLCELRERDETEWLSEHGNSAPATRSTLDSLSAHDESELTDSDPTSAPR